MIIPFFIPHAGCPHQCLFCDQKRITGANEAPAVSAVSRKIQSYLATGKNQGPVEVAFYGGTFTALPLELQAAYLAEVAPFLRSGAVSSIRVSTRPDAVTPAVIGLLRKHRVRTVELGVQSLDDGILHKSGRGHTSADTVMATALLRGHGFSIGFQLMPGLPGDTFDLFRETIARTVELKPDVVRLYPALVIKDTPLEQLFRSGQYRPLTLDDAVSWCKEAVSTFRKSDITVIRIGLQSADSLESPGAVVAGPYHPAFRQLVDSALFLDAMQQELEKTGQAGMAVFRIHPGDLSTALGQNRCNVPILQQRFGLERIRFIQDRTVQRGTITTG